MRQNFPWKEFIYQLLISSNHHFFFEVIHSFVFFFIFSFILIFFFFEVEQKSELSNPFLYITSILKLNQPFPL